MQVLKRADLQVSVPAAYPLSLQQQGLWFLYQLAPESSAYNIHYTIQIRGALDLVAWQQAWQSVFQQNPILRSRYTESQGEPIRVVQMGEIPLQRIQAETWSDSQLQAAILSEAEIPFRLETEPAIRICLYQCRADEFIQLITLHHIAGDMWTFDLLMQAWQQLYQGQQLRSQQVCYAEYVQWQSEMLKSRQGEEFTKFWQAELVGEIAPLDLPSDPILTQQNSSLSVLLSPELVQALKLFAKSQHCSLYRLVLTAFFVLLYRYTGNADFAIGTAMAARWGQEEFREVVGYFSNMVPLRVAIAGEECFENILNQISQKVTEIQAYQDLPLQEVVKLHRGDLFSVTFTWQKHRWQNLIPTLEFEPYLLEHQCGATFDLDLQVVEAGDRFNVVWQYNPDRFAKSTIERLSNQLQTLLSRMILNPKARISHLEILPPKERHQLLIEWNSTEQPLPNTTVPELISAQAAKTPNAIAVEFEQAQLTYRELDQRSNQLAHFLKTQGVAPEDLVGICMARSIDFIVGILGILKAGAAFVPLDPTYPEERLTLLISDAQVKLLLTEDLNWNEIQSFSTEAIENTVQGHSLAYVIYTSGSTGKPKGVMIEHRNLLNHNLAILQAYELQSQDQVLQTSTLSFDIAIEEIFPTLICGAKLVLRSADCLLSTQHFLKFVHTHQLTVLNLPTALWHQIVFDLVALDLKIAPSVRLVIVGGEKVSRSAYLTWLDQVGSSPRWLNGYGPTETTVTATLEAPKSTDQELLIGRAIANTRTYVLDSQLQPVPIGVAGELWIGGMGVARGYLRRPEQTQARFVTHQFEGLPPERLYRTGDLVRYWQDGRLEYLGRIDDQVKIRGYRIELGEVEFQIDQHPAIQDAIVLAQQNHLVAYVIASETIETASLQRFLKQTLPSYMIPSVFVQLPTFPLTANGKVDRKALLAIAPLPTVTRSTALPETDLERQLIPIWQEILDVQSIGVEDDFFELGGHSLLMLRLAAKLEQVLERPIQVATLYQGQTIRQLAQALQADYSDLSDAVVRFQAGEPGHLPLFCIPGAKGNFRFCEGLRTSLDPAQPIYGIQELTIESETTLEAMAQHCIQEIQQIQPKGPYLLLGYSIGSAVVYEIAQQFYAQGQEVSLLVLIAPGNLIALPALLKPLQKLPVLQNFNVLFELLTRWSAYPAECQGLSVLDRGKLFLKKLALSLKLIAIVSWFGTLEQLAGKSDPYQDYNQIVNCYCPTESAFPVQLFISETEFELPEAWVSWKKVAANQLTISVLPGDHYTCVEKAAIQQLVKHITPLLPRQNLS